MIQCGWVKLNELHVLDRSFGAVYHRYAVACGYKRIGSGSVDGSHSSCGHECHPRQKCVNFACRRIKHVGTVACDVGCTPCDNLAQMVLSDDFYSEVIFEYVYVGVGFYGLDKRLLYLSAGIVGVM